MIPISDKKRDEIVKMLVLMGLEYDVEYDGQTGGYEISIVGEKG